MTETNKMKCPVCKVDMNHHADKVDYSVEPAPADRDFGGALQEVHSCPSCGKTWLRREVDI